MKFSNKDLFSKWPKVQFYVDLVTFAEEIVNGKLRFLCIVIAQLSRKEQQN